LPHSFQNLATSFLRQVEIQKKKMRAIERYIAIHGVDESHSLFAIIKYDEFEFETGLF